MKKKKGSLMGRLQKEAKEKVCDPSFRSANELKTLPLKMKKSATTWKLIFDGL